MGKLSVIAALLSVISTLLVGFVLTLAPWTSLWDANMLLQAHPALRALMLSSFVRGGVTGLGLVNILLALHEAREHIVGERHET
jgi:hypothetical protein